MDETAVVALVVAAAAVGLYWFTTKQQQETAMLIAQINARKAQQSSEPYALSIGDVITVGGTALATYLGGPGAGAKAAMALSS